MTPTELLKALEEPLRYDRDGAMIVNGECVDVIAEHRAPRYVALPVDVVDAARTRIAELQASNKLIREALSASLGYLRNARIDLQTGAPKLTAIDKLWGCIRLVESALAQTEAKS